MATYSWPKASIPGNLCVISLSRTCKTTQTSYVCDSENLTVRYRNELSFKLGHRRVCFACFIFYPVKTTLSLPVFCSQDVTNISNYYQKLQRAITDYHLRAKTAPLRINNAKRTSQVANDIREASNTPLAPVVEEGPRQKRKYRRHPKVC